MNDAPENPVEKKLDEVLKVLQKIEQQGHRNPWGSGAKFVILNFAKIVASILTLVLLWKIWGLVNGISGNFDFLLGKIGDLKFW
ncbi:MAG: hypothetical protein WCV72_04135 [Patescibacteria group bacterium]|jgi:hypothetical protein